MALALLLVMGAGLGWAPAAAAQSASPGASREYRIPAGPLDSALSKFSQQSGVWVFHDPALITDKKTPGLSGAHAPLPGLTQLLKGTGLKAVDKGGGRLALAEQPPGGDQEEVTALPAVRVRSQKDKMEPGDHSISVETLRRTMAKDMADIFAIDPSFSIGGGGRYAQRLYLRGIESNNLNITIDGAGQGKSLHQHMGDIGNMDPDILKAVEVQPGPGADRGPGALGGSIVFETADAQDLLEKGKNVGATLRGAYASADKSWLGSGSVYGALNNTYGILAHFSASDRQDYRIGDGDEAPNTAGQSRDYFVKFSMLDLSKHSLRLSAERNSDEGLYIWGYLGSDMGYPSEDSFAASYIKVKRETYTLNYNFNPDNPWVDAKLNLYYNDNTVENDDWNSEYTSEQVGGDLRNTFSFLLGPTSHRLTIGADYKGEESTGTNFTDGSTKSDDSKNLGLFIQDRVSIGPLGLSFGARFDDFEADFGPHSFSGSEVSPNVGATYEMIKGLIAFASYGEAVRASGIIPGSWMTNIQEDAVFKVSEPESSRQIQGGLRYRAQGLVLDSDHVRMEGTLFNTRIKNNIEAVGRRGIISEIINGDDLISQGFELRLVWGLPDFESSLGFSHVRTEDEDGNPVGVVRRQTGATGDRLVWDNRWRPLECLTLGYTMNGVFRLTDVPEGEPQRPGYVLHGIQAMWQVPWVPNLTLSLVVNNLLDERYSEHSSIYCDTGIMEEPGLDVRFGVTYKF
jgi:hemoglobin/transferrin/lactoferrin receptor protein